MGLVPICYFWELNKLQQKMHLSLENGEIIDLYGLSIIDGVYHIFFLYKTEFQGKQWGHFATKDFQEYKFSSGKAEIIGYKTGNTHFFANTVGELLLLELIKPPGKGRRSFFSLPKKVVIHNEEMLRYPAQQLKELREYKRSVKLCEGESADTFGAVFEAKLTFAENIYRLRLRDDVTVEGENGSITVQYGNLKQSLEVDDIRTIHVFSDVASLEIFVGGKVLSLPTDKNENGTVTILSGECRAEIYKLKSINVVKEAPARPCPFL